MKLKYNNRQKFTPILPDHDEWPVVKMSKNRDAFIQQVARATYKQIKKIKI